MNRPQCYPLQYLLLSPSEGKFSPGWSPAREDKRLYQSSLRAAQRFRSRIYLRDGAIQKWQVDHDGRYRMTDDEQSWHLLLTGPRQQVVGCARFLVHPNTITFNELTVRHSPIATDRFWSAKVRHAIETEIRIARSEGMPYVELGGWALSEAWRGTKAALKILLASYAWGRLMGGCRCSCTATVRHGSSSILRRIGGAALEYHGEELPPYHDPAYGCEMELLRFDSRYPNPRFSSLVHEVEAELAHCPIITSNERFRATANRHTHSLVA